MPASDVSTINNSATSEKELDMVTDWTLFQTMERYGGSFAQAIAAAAHCADPENLARLKAAFPELMQEYRNMADLIAKQKAANAQA